MRLTIQIILLIMILILGLCAIIARRSYKPIARSVSLLILSLIPAILGNFIIIGATERGLAETGMYIYFIGMDIIMAFLLKFTLDYCYYSWENKLAISLAIYKISIIHIF